LRKLNLFFQSLITWKLSTCFVYTTYAFISMNCYIYTWNRYNWDNVDYIQLIINVVIKIQLITNGILMIITWFSLSVLEQIVYTIFALYKITCAQYFIIILLYIHYYFIIILLYIITNKNYFVYILSELILRIIWFSN